MAVVSARGVLGRGAPRLRVAGRPWAVPACELATSLCPGRPGVRARLASGCDISRSARSDARLGIVAMCHLDPDTAMPLHHVVPGEHQLPNMAAAEGSRRGIRTLTPTRSRHRSHSSSAPHSPRPLMCLPLPPSKVALAIKAPRCGAALAMWCFGVLWLTVDDRREKGAAEPIVVLAPPRPAGGALALLLRPRP